MNEMKVCCPDMRICVHGNCTGHQTCTPCKATELGKDDTYCDSCYDLVPATSLDAIYGWDHSADMLAFCNRDCQLAWVCPNKEWCSTCNPRGI